MKTKQVDLESLSPESRAALDQLCVLATGLTAEELKKNGGQEGVQDLANVAATFAATL